MARAVEYYLLDTGWAGKVLAKVEDNIHGFIFGQGKWSKADHIAAKVTGMGGRR